LPEIPAWSLRDNSGLWDATASRLLPELTSQNIPFSNILFFSLLASPARRSTSLAVSGDQIS
jgi:hypothetical protein